MNTFTLPFAEAQREYSGPPDTKLVRLTLLPPPCRSAPRPPSPRSQNHPLALRLAAEVRVAGPPCGWRASADLRRAAPNAPQILQTSSHAS